MDAVEQLWEFSGSKDDQPGLDGSSTWRGMGNRDNIIMIGVCGLHSNMGKISVIRVGDNEEISGFLVVFCIFLSQVVCEFLYCKSGKMCIWSTICVGDNMEMLRKFGEIFVGFCTSLLEVV